MSKIILNRVDVISHTTLPYPKLVLEVSNLLHLVELHGEAALLLQLPSGGLHHLLPHLHLPGKGVVPQASTEPDLLEAQ